MKKWNLAVVGVTGMVGRTFIKVLEEKNLPIDRFHAFASSRSAGSQIVFNGTEYLVEELKEDSFDRGIDIALFSAGGSASKKYAPIAAKKGCIVIDNSSTWRMDDQTPLVVPEVNPEDIRWNRGIIANPNCSTIQAMVALKPLQKAYGIRRIVYSTYQAVSGAGLSGWMDLEEGIKGKPPRKFPYPIAGNCLPHIDVFQEDGYTKEEMKMVHETRKILHAPNIRITATCVRVPVYHGHSESINVELEKPYILEEVIAILAQSPGVIVQNEFEKEQYPMPITAAGTDEVYVGRIRRDDSVENGLNLWVVADNIRKGAASNAVQIAETIMNSNQ